MSSKQPSALGSLLRSLALAASLLPLQAAVADPLPGHGALEPGLSGNAGSAAAFGATPDTSSVQFSFWAQSSLGPLNLLVVSHSEGSTRSGPNTARSRSDVTTPFEDVMVGVSPVPELATLSVWLIGLGLVAGAMWRQQGREAALTGGEDTAIMD